ncbi:hypothetical protein GOBAR_AA22808 [Gossypium barbadense]|uniref:Uncharacterized protein n=1 Tax=Gossypium barbadense TaxID=3634 RepID=A0A2P5X3G7_GOSBA|nr:hypothetical protein GOBAR_AA22808 [Gossypium barbadense]
MVSNSLIKDIAVEGLLFSRLLGPPPRINIITLGLGELYLSRLGLYMIFGGSVSTSTVKQTKRELADFVFHYVREHLHIETPFAMNPEEGPVDGRDEGPTTLVLTLANIMCLVETVAEGFEVAPCNSSSGLDQALTENKDLRDANWGHHDHGYVRGTCISYQTS